MRSIASRSLAAIADGVDEVEPQAIGRDERAGLLHVRPERLPQRGVQQVRRRVVAADRRRGARGRPRRDAARRTSACPCDTVT